MSWLHGIATRLRLMVSRRSSESRFDEEIDFHVDMEAARLARELGVDPGEARRRAMVAFGGVEKHREALRDGRDVAWLSELSHARLGDRQRDSPGTGAQFKHRPTARFSLLPVPLHVAMEGPGCHGIVELWSVWHKII